MSKVKIPLRSAAKSSLRPCLALGAAVVFAIVSSGCAELSTYLNRYVIPPPRLRIDGKIVDEFASDVEGAVSGENSTGGQAPIDARLRMTAGLREALSNRRSRAAEIQRWKNQGVVGENDMGHLQAVPRQGSAEEALDDSALYDLIREENKDRAALYREVARQIGAGSPERFTEMRRVWTERLRRNARRGDWVQLPRDETFFARFQRTSLARRLPPDVGLGQWVRVP